VSIRHAALAFLALWLALCVHAQTAAPAKTEARSDLKADPKAEEAAAAMERAKRLAAGPMRVILEASKGKRREAEPGQALVPTSAADAGSLRTVAARSAPALEITARAAPAPQATAAEPAPLPAAPAPLSARVTLSSDSLQNRSVAPVPGLESAVTAPAMPALAPTALPKLADAYVKPKLIRRVDPELSQRLQDDLGRGAVVAVDLSISADGRVAAVAMITPVPPRVQRVLAGALEQWRFEPLPADRVHRIELVFNTD
jgi:hypothetical protein